MWFGLSSQIYIKHLSHDDPAVLSGHSGSGVPLVGVLHECVALVDGAAHDLAVLGEDGLHVGLGDEQRVEVPDKDAGVERARVRFVGDIAAGHEAGGGGRAIHVCAGVVS